MACVKELQLAQVLAAPSFQRYPIIGFVLSPASVLVRRTLARPSTEKGGESGAYIIEGPSICR